MKFIILGDMHIRGDNPRNRIGNYYQDCKKKLQEIFDIAEEHSAEIIQVGDVFNSPTISLNILSDLVTFLWNQGKMIYTVPGNHDIFAHNLSTLNRTALGFLINTGYMKDVNKCKFSSYYEPKVVLIGRGFDHTLDHDYSEYILQDKYKDIEKKILVIHGMLLPESPGFEMRHSTIDRVAEITNADVIISGHYHEPFMKRCKDKLFINPGALMRISATNAEIERTPQVVLLDTDKLNDQLYMPEIIKLNTAKPGFEILDRTQIEVNELRAENMKRFIESLEFNSEAQYMNIQEIIEQIAEREGMQVEIARKALERISKVRENRA